MPKILRFAIFLLAYALLADWARRNPPQPQDALTSGKPCWAAERRIVMALAMFFVPIYLLSGLWSLKLVLLVFSALQLATSMNWVVGLFQGKQSEQLALGYLWASTEIGIKYAKTATAILLALSFSLFISYPIVAGVFFFRYPWGSLSLQNSIFKCSLIFLIFVSYASLEILTTMMLASDHLDEDTRQALFMTLLPALIPTAVYVAIAFRAFGFAGKPFTFEFWGFSQTFSLQAMLPLLALFAVTLLFPYLIGTQRARRKNLALLEITKGYLAELADILEAPTAGQYEEELDALRNKVIARRDEFTKEDPILTVAAVYKNDPTKIPLVFKPTWDATESARDFDPRFKLLVQLSKLAEETENIAANLKDRAQGTVELAAEHWSRRYESRKNELDSEIEGTKIRKPLITLAVGALAATVASGVLDDVAKKAVQWITHVPT